MKRLILFCESGEVWRRYDDEGVAELGRRAHERIAMFEDIIGPLPPAVTTQKPAGNYEYEGCHWIATTVVDIKGLSETDYMLCVLAYPYARYDIREDYYLFDGR